MKLLHLFSGYNSFTLAAQRRGHLVVSFDIKNYKNCPPSSIIGDFLDYDFFQFNIYDFDFVLVGFPCTTFSKASGGYHFKAGLPITLAAQKSIQMIYKLKKVLDHFKCDFLIENPTSALFSNAYFKKTFDLSNLYHIRVHQFLYDHPTFKQTDLVTTKHLLWLDNVVYRVNGKNSCIPFDKLSLKERQKYTDAFCEKLLWFVETSI